MYNPKDASLNLQKDCVCVLHHTICSGPQLNGRSQNFHVVPIVIFNINFHKKSE